MDLATAQTHLDDAIAQLASARKAAAYGVGDMSKTSQSIPDLERQVTYWQRIVDGFTVTAAGGSNTMASVPRFR
jgi:hypothetical protein